MRRYVKTLKSKSVFYSVYGNDAYVVYYFTDYDSLIKTVSI